MAILLGMRREIKPAPIVCFDNNILSRMLSTGMGSSIEKLSKRLEEQTRRNICTRKTDLVLTRASYYEYLGIRGKDIITAEELDRLGRQAEDGHEEGYFVRLYSSISNRLEQATELEPSRLVATLERRLPRLPRDSANFVSELILQKIKSRGFLIVLKGDIAHHLFCSVELKGDRVYDRLLYAFRDSLKSYKAKQILSIGKLLPQCWELIRSGKDVILTAEQKNTITKMVAMHKTADFLDSDMIHLASVGVVRALPQRVYCFTEDPYETLRQRCLMYKTLFQALLTTARLRIEDPQGREFRGVDFKPGHVICLDKTLSISNHFSVQTIETLPNYPAVENVT